MRCMVVCLGPAPSYNNLKYEKGIQTEHVITYTTMKKLTLPEIKEFVETIPGCHLIAAAVEKATGLVPICAFWRPFTPKEQAATGQTEIVGIACDMKWCDSHQDYHFTKSPDHLQDAAAKVIAKHGGISSNMVNAETGEPEGDEEMTFPVPPVENRLAKFFGSN